MQSSFILVANEYDYAHEHRVHYYNFIREDIRFNSLDELREQLPKDKEVAVGLLG